MLFGVGGFCVYLVLFLFFFFSVYNLCSFFLDLSRVCEVSVGLEVFRIWVGEAETQVRVIVCY